MIPLTLLPTYRQYLAAKYSRHYTLPLCIEKLLSELNVTYFIDVNNYNLFVLKLQKRLSNLTDRLEQLTITSSNSVNPESITDFGESDRQLVRNYQLEQTIINSSNSVNF